MPGRVGHDVRMSVASARIAPRSLFWRIALVNGALATAAVVLLAITPLTVSNPVTSHQALLLLAGLLIVIASNTLLLRVSLGPLRDLTKLMERIDLLQPGERLDGGGARELDVLTSAFNEMLERLERERRLSSSRVVGREEDERRRIASELHDQVGQGLTALLLHLKGTVDQAPPELRDDLVEAQAIARDNLNEVRRIARRLRPTMLDDLGLQYALLALADTAEERSGPAVRRQIDLETPRVPSATELALYRVAQEAVTNALRHANASWIEIAFGPADGGRVELVVTDDGRGMLYAADVEGGGIRGMRERALAVGARLSVDSRPGGGTSVTITAAAS